MAITVTTSGAKMGNGGTPLTVQAPVYAGEQGANTSAAAPVQKAMPAVYGGTANPLPGQFMSDADSRSDGDMD